MAGKNRQKQRDEKKRRKEAAMKNPGFKSKYALKVRARYEDTPLVKE